MEVTKPTVSDLVIMDIERDGTPPNATQPRNSRPYKGIINNHCPLNMAIAAIALGLVPNVIHPEGHQRSPENPHLFHRTVSLQFTGVSRRWWQLKSC